MPLDVLIALLLQKLMERWGGGQPVEPPRSAVDVETLRKGLDAISGRLESLEDLDLHQAASALRELATALPEVDPEASAWMLAVIDALLQQSPQDPQRLLLMARGVSDVRELQRIVETAAGDAVRVYVQSAGVVQPDPRTAMLQLLIGARRAATILGALLLFLLVYVFDVDHAPQLRQAVR